MSADKEVITALILQHTRCSSSVCHMGTSKPAAENAAAAIMRAGFKQKDAELERRVDQLEKWTRGEF